MTFSSWSLIAAAALSFGSGASVRAPAPTTGEVRAMSLVSAAGKAEFLVQSTVSSR